MTFLRLHFPVIRAFSLSLAASLLLLGCADLGGRTSSAPSQSADRKLRAGTVQAYATNKAILFEMQDGLPGYRVLDGRWGLENLAVGIPKGREAAMPWVKQFAAEAQSSGLLRGIVQRAGLRGTT